MSRGFLLVRAELFNVRFWHLTDKPPAPEFVAYWTNNGQKAALGLDLSAAIDPTATSPAFRVAVAKGLCSIGCLAPRFNQTRGKVRARRIYVAFQTKKHFRVSHWKNCRCLVDGLQIGLQRRQLGRSQLFLHFFFDNPEAAIQLAHPVL